MIPDATFVEKEQWFKRLGGPWLRHYQEAIAEIRRLQVVLESSIKNTENLAFEYGKLEEALAAHQAVVRAAEVLWKMYVPLASDPDLRFEPWRNLRKALNVIGTEGSA